MDELFKLRGALSNTRPPIPEWQTPEYNRADDGMHGSVPLGRQMSPEFAKLMAGTLPPPLPWKMQVPREVISAYKEHTRNLSEVSDATGEVSDSNRVMFDTIHELDGGMGDLSGTMDLATVGMDGMNASMGMGAQEALALAGQVGTLEDKFLTVTQAADGLKHTIGSMPKTGR